MQHTCMCGSATRDGMVFSHVAEPHATSQLGSMIVKQLARSAYVMRRSEQISLPEMDLSERRPTCGFHAGFEHLRDEGQVEPLQPCVGHFHPSRPTFHYFEVNIILVLRRMHEVA